jgi:tetratricopeptide (TPR) repeat protein
MRYTALLLLFILAADPAGAATLKGDQFLQNARFYNAICAYQSEEKVAARDPGLHRRLLTNLAFAQMSIGRDEDADKTLDRLAVNASEAATPEYKRLLAALESYKTSGKYIDEGTNLLHERKFDDAIARYKSAVAKMPHNAEFHLLLAYAYKSKFVSTKNLTDWRAAKAEFDQVKRLDPVEFKEICKDATKPKI